MLFVPNLLLPAAARIPCKRQCASGVPSSSSISSTVPNVPLYANARRDMREHSRILKSGVQDMEGACPTSQCKRIVFDAMRARLRTIYSSGGRGVKASFQQELSKTLAHIAPELDGDSRFQPTLNASPPRRLLPPIIGRNSLRCSSSPLRCGHDRICPLPLLARLTRLYRRTSIGDSGTSFLKQADARAAALSRAWIEASDT